MIEASVIGITGGIGAGKSVVSRILRLMGFPVYDCDSEAKRIMNENPDVRTELKHILGESIYNDKGELDRVKMSSAIFTDSELRDKVNRVVHAAVKSDFIQWTLGLDSPVFIESAILITGKLDGLCSKIWLVEAPMEIRIERVRKRNGLSDDAIVSRIRSQEKEFDALPADKVQLIDNGGVEPLMDQILQLLEITIINNIFKIEIETCSEKF